MNLNLRIIADELAGMVTGTHLVTDRYELDCAYPLPCHAGDVLLPGPVYIARDEELRDCTRQEGGVANVICLGDTPDRLLRASDVNVIEADGGVSPSDLLAHVQEIFHRYYRWEHDLHEVIEGGEPLSRVAVVSQDIVRNPMLFSLAGLKCVFHNADYLRRESQDAYREYCRSYTESGELLEEGGYPSLDVITDMIADPDYQDADEASEPTVLPGQRGSYPTLFYNVGHGDNHLGRLHFDGVQHDFTERDFILIKLLGDLLERAVTLRGLLEPGHADALNQTLGKLLSHRLADERDIQAALNDLDWKIADRYFVAVLTSHSFASDRQTLGTVANRLMQQLPNGYALVFDDRLVYIFNLTQAKRTQAQFLEHVVPLLRDNLLIGGISVPFSDFKNLYYFYLQALRALALGSKANPTAWFYRYDDYLLDDLASRILDRHTLESSSPRGLRALVSYDATHEGNLVPLLKTYLNCGMSVAETSRELYIHRNTCLYRLRRIREVGGLDLDEPRVRLELETAFALGDYCDKYGIER